MNCYYHAEAQATAFCRSCGRPLCPECQRLNEGTVYCPEHAPVVNAAPGSGPGPIPNPYADAAAAAAVRTSPGLAFALGWIPGVGAIYNGQYLKGLVHAVIFGLIVSLLSSGENGPMAPFFGILLSAFVFYMPIEAYQTAKRRQAGVAVDEWSAFAPPGAPGTTYRRGSAGPVILIGIGVLFLLDTLDLVNFRTVGRFWPLLLIGAGAYMLYCRTAGRAVSPTQFGTTYTPASPASQGHSGEYGGGRHDQ